MARLIYYDQFITQKPREITREHIQLRAVMDLHTLLKRFGIYSYYSPVKHIAPSSEEGLSICKRLGIPPLGGALDTY